jgi:hypothetical protein
VQWLVLPGNGNLNVPWGLALAGPNFGVFSYALIVGNFGDGTVAACDTPTGDCLGDMQDGNGNDLSIDDLLGLQFGSQGSNGNANGGDATTLYFAAAPFRWRARAVRGSSTCGRLDKSIMNSIGRSAADLRRD